ncbi:MAG: hypothetical protein P8099_21090, partial [Gemmatimonadota bacterium]
MALHHALKAPAARRAGHLHLFTGYDAVQLGFDARKEKHSTRAERGHAARVGLEAAPAVLREFRVAE